MNIQRALRRLEHLLKNPERRTLEENAPVIVLRNGKHVMVETCLVKGRTGYKVSLDFGCTCREIGRVSNTRELLDLIMTECK